LRTRSKQRPLLIEAKADRKKLPYRGFILRGIDLLLFQSPMEALRSMSEGGLGWIIFHQAAVT
jgi:hypothetical protein